MAFRRCTVVVIPEGHRRVRQFRFSRALLLFLCLFLALCLSGLGWLANRYVHLVRHTPALIKLQTENRLQRKELAFLAQRIHEASKKVNEIKAFDDKLKAMVNLETGEDDSKYRGIGGSEPSLASPAGSQGKNHRQMIRLMHRSLDRLDEELAVRKSEEAELHQFLENQKMILASTPSIWPTKGWLSSRFGQRISPFTGQKEFHKGIDISTRMNAPIVSPADGIVTSIRWDRGYGRMLTIDHGYGIVTRYAHLSKCLVKKGQYVKRGETVALVGKTGRTTGPHLHYEVRVNGVSVDPLHYIMN